MILWVKTGECDVKRKLAGVCSERRNGSVPTSGQFSHLLHRRGEFLGNADGPNYIAQANHADLNQ